MYELYLVHSGILGMHWGVRRFQNKDGSLTSAGKERYNGKNAPRHKPTNARKAAKKRAAALEKARQTRAANAKLKEDKEKALKSGKASEVLKYRQNLTDAELKKAIDRINLENNLRDLAGSERKRGETIVGKVLNVIDNARKGAATLASAYDMAARIHNAYQIQKYGPKNAKVWTLVGGGGGGEGKKKK